MALLMGLSVVSLFGLVSAVVGGLPAVVSVEGEATLDCPRASALRQLLAATDGLEVAAANATEDIWAVTLRRSGDTLQLGLRDPGGVSRLFRELPARSGECDAAARAAAIVVERYFRDLAWVPDASVAGLATAPGQQATVAVGTADGRSRVAAPRFVVGAGPAYWTRSGGLSVLVEGRLRVAGPIWAGAGTLLLPFRADQTLGAGDGAAQAWGVPVLGRLGVSDAQGRFGFRLGVEALLTVEQGESRNIATPATAIRAVLAAGVGAAASIDLGARWRIAAEVAGYRAALGRSFKVLGIAGPVLEPPPWQGIVAIHLEWIVLP